MKSARICSVRFRAVMSSRISSATPRRRAPARRMRAEMGAQVPIGHSRQREFDPRAPRAPRAPDCPPFRRAAARQPRTAAPPDCAAPRPDRRARRAFRSARRRLRSRARYAAGCRAAATDRGFAAITASAAASRVSAWMSLASYLPRSPAFRPGQSARPTSGAAAAAPTAVPRGPFASPSLSLAPIFSIIRRSAVSEVRERKRDRASRPSERRRRRRRRSRRSQPGRRQRTQRGANRRPGRDGDAGAS